MSIMYAPGCTLMLNLRRSVLITTTWDDMVVSLAQLQLYVAQYGLVRRCRDARLGRVDRTCTMAGVYRLVGKGRRGEITYISVCQMRWKVKEAGGKFLYEQLS